MIWLAVLAGLASLGLLGALTLAATGVRTRSGPQNIVIDFVTGAALLAVFGMIAVALEWRLSVIPFYVILAGCIGVALRRRTVPSLPRLRLQKDVLARILLVCGAAVVLVILFASARDQLWWDGWAIWALKARVLFLDGTLTRDFLSPDGAYVFTHPDYPLAVPLVGWWLARHAGEAAPAFASFAGAVWFAMLPLLLWSSLRHAVGERLAALAGLGMALFWPIAFYATGGTADVVIALCLLGAIVELERGVTQDDVAALVRCSIFLTLGILTKNEGLALAVVFLLVGSATLLRTGERRPQRYLPLVLPFVAFLPWWLLGSALGIRESTIALSQLGAVGDRVPLLAARLAGLGLSFAWLPVLVIGVVGAAAGVYRGAVRVGAGWLVLGAYFVVVCMVYLLTPHDLPWLLNTSLPRVLGPFVPALVYLSVQAAAGVRQQTAGALARSG